MMNEVNFKNISYSVCVDYRSDFRTEPLKQILPRRIYSWIDDNNAMECYNCNVQFSIIKCIRKHHCRLCGRIFCYNCSNYYATIPENLLSDESKKGTWNSFILSYTSKGPTKYRVCKNCNDILQNIQSVKELIEVFKVIKFNIEDLLLISRICKLWQYAANYILSIFREIQYKLPTDKYTQYEIELLQINSKYIAGHNKYMIHLLKIYKCEDELMSSIDIIKPNKNKILSCWSMMCSRNCKNTLTSFDAFNLLIYNFNNKSIKIIEKIAISNLICNDLEFRCYIPILVYYLRYDDGIISNFLIKKCTRNFLLFSSLYWELQIYSKNDDNNNIYPTVIEQLKKYFFGKHHDKSSKLSQQIIFVNVVNNISKSICGNIKYKGNENNDLSYVKNNMVSPLDPSILVKDVIVDKIKIKDSATRPILIPLLTNNDKKYNILYKHDDVRKDQIIINIIRIIDLIVQQEEHIDLNIVTYDILPIDKDHGIIKIIDNCDTIYYIKTNLNMTILNYILENNGDIKIREIRERFIKSTAAYCVITYLLGIGDRHLDNIMVTRDGRLFHIDYGYILGKDPSYVTPGIRITAEIIEAIGGVNSIYYTQFTELCTRIYNCLRRNIDIIMNMVMMLPKMTTINITESEIIEDIIKRFIPGENYINAKLHFENQLENQGYTDNIKDWFHYINKEKLTRLNIF